MINSLRIVCRTRKLRRVVVFDRPVQCRPYRAPLKSPEVNALSRRINANARRLNELECRMLRYCHLNEWLRSLTEEVLALGQRVGP